MSTSKRKNVKIISIDLSILIEKKVNILCKYNINLFYNYLLLNGLTTILLAI